jgi:hypothetical protein
MTRLAADLSGIMARDPDASGGGSAAHRGTARGFAKGALGPSARVIAAFVLGSVAGAVGHARFAARSNGGAAQVARSTGPTSSGALPEPRPNGIVERTPFTDAPAADDPTRPREKRSATAESRPVTAAPPPADPADLRVERALLDQAQRALARGDAAASLNVLNAHKGRFPRGRLEEEREALAVKTLAALGRNDEAKTRGVRFRVRFPDSLLGSSVDDTMGTIP